MIVTEARGAIPTDCLFWRNMKWALQFGLRKNKKDGVCEQNSRAKEDHDSN